MRPCPFLSQRRPSRVLVLPGLRVHGGVGEGGGATEEDSMTKVGGEHRAEEAAGGGA